jgi:hypothetical protein
VYESFVIMARLAANPDNSKKRMSPVNTWGAQGGTSAAASVSPMMHGVIAVFRMLE